jgi:hypothetical protein
MALAPGREPMRSKSCISSTQLAGRRPTLGPGSTIETHHAQLSCLGAPDVLLRVGRATAGGSWEWAARRKVAAPRSSHRLIDRATHCPNMPARRGRTNNPATCREPSTRTRSPTSTGCRVPVALADDILGIGSTLSKGLRAAGQYPVPLLRNRGRHHAVSLSSLLTYLGLPLPTPTATGETPPQEGKPLEQANVDNGEETAA